MFFIFLIILLIFQILKSPFSYVPSTWYGLFFGILASLFFIISFSYIYFRRIFNINYYPRYLWYRIHFYFAFFSIYFSLLHSNFKLRGKIPFLLFIFLLLSVISGFLIYFFKFTIEPPPKTFHIKSLYFLRNLHLLTTIIFFIFLILHII